MRHKLRARWGWVFWAWLIGVGPTLGLLTLPGVLAVAVLAAWVVGLYWLFTNWMNDYA